MQTKKLRHSEIFGEARSETQWPIAAYEASRVLAYSLLDWNIHMGTPRIHPGNMYEYGEYAQWGMEKTMSQALVDLKAQAVT